MKTIAKVGKPVRLVRKATEKKSARLTIAEWAKSVSGTVNSGKGDLSTREGFGN